MNNRLVFFVFLALVLASPALAADFTLTSSDITQDKTLDMKQVLNGFGCTGENVSPALAWANPPAGTKSFALTVYDPDAPTGSGWWHWVVFDLPAAARALPAGAGSVDSKGLPAGAVQSRTDFGAPGYGGACPPQGHGQHRYVFTLFALDVERLGLAPDSSAAMVGCAMWQHTLAKASITARYGR